MNTLNYKISLTFFGLQVAAYNEIDKSNRSI